MSFHPGMKTVFSKQGQHFARRYHFPGQQRHDGRNGRSLWTSRGGRRCYAADKCVGRSSNAPPARPSDEVPLHDHNRHASGRRSLFSELDGTFHKTVIQKILRITEPPMYILVHVSTSDFAGQVQAVPEHDITTTCGTYNHYNRSRDEVTVLTSHADML